MDEYGTSPYSLLDKIGMTSLRLKCLSKTIHLLKGTSFENVECNVDDGKKKETCKTEIHFNWDNTISIYFKEKECELPVNNIIYDYAWSCQSRDDTIPCEDSLYTCIEFYSCRKIPRNIIQKENVPQVLVFHQNPTSKLGKNKYAFIIRIGNYRIWTGDKNPFDYKSYKRSYFVFPNKD